jgi:hypothetical protein
MVVEGGRWLEEYAHPPPPPTWLPWTPHYHHPILSVCVSHSHSLSEEGTPDQPATFCAALHLLYKPGIFLYSSYSICIHHMYSCTSDTLRCSFPLPPPTPVPASFRRASIDLFSGACLPVFPSLHHHLCKLIYPPPQPPTPMTRYIFIICPTHTHARTHAHVHAHISLCVFRLQAVVDHAHHTPPLPLLLKVGNGVGSRSPATKRCPTIPIPHSNH